MLQYDEMRYFVSFANCGRLSAVAEQYAISQPTITRAMQKAEETFGVPLFHRTKNSIRLNDNGVLAAEELTLLLKQTENAIRKVRAYDHAARTVSIGSGAAIQLPELIERLSEIYPDKPVSWETQKPPALLDGLQENLYQLIILPFIPENPQYRSVKIGGERLLFLLPESHRFAGRESLSMAEMNGENILLYSEIGFWADIVKRKMPKSRFLVQCERYTFEELVLHSILPCFTSDLILSRGLSYNDRVAIPIDDPEVQVSYYLVCKKENLKTFSPLFSGR